MSPPLTIAVLLILLLAFGVRVCFALLLRPTNPDQRSDWQ